MPVRVPGNAYQDRSPLTIVSIDFPHGETRLVVHRSGEAFLFYGALDRECVIKRGTFDIDRFYRRLRGRLHANVPAEERPNPRAKYGMVSIQYKNKTEKDYLIYDGELAERLFEKARKNLIGEAGLAGPPLRWPCLLPSSGSRTFSTAPAQTPRPSPNNMFPQFSGDGKKIVFTSDRDGDPEIYVMNVDGSNAVRLTHAPGRDAHPYFSRDGRRILFQSPRENREDTNIYVMNCDGSNVVQLTKLKGFAGVPTYSPDEKSIVFQWRESNNFDDDKKWRICLMNADGSNLRLITAGEANDQVPNWSRDGKRLLFYSDRTGKNQIYTMKLDGSDVRRVAVTNSNDNAAFWSPDNRKIAFTSDRHGNSDIFVMDADGANVRRLTDTRATERAAVWSPDGKRIAFSSDGDGPSGIYIMNADGSNLVRLARYQSRENVECCLQ